jgi:hypothetical protein
MRNTPGEVVVRTKVVWQRSQLVTTTNIQNRPREVAVRPLVKTPTSFHTPKVRVVGRRAVGAVVKTHTNIHTAVMTKVARNQTMRKIRRNQ